MFSRCYLAYKGVFEYIRMLSRHFPVYNGCFGDIFVHKRMFSRCFLEHKKCF